jgi:AbrB family looped-hinge helix DNA binding protein
MASVILKRRHITRVGKRNQVTIPVEMLRALGVGPGDRVEVSRDDGVLSIRKAEDAVDRAFGLLKRPGQPTRAIEDMKRASRAAEDEAAAARYARTLPDA